MDLRSSTSPGSVDPAAPGGPLSVPVATPRLYVAIAITTGLVAVADLLDPLGMATWVFYLVPLALCLFVWRPRAPLVLAGVCSTLIAVGYFTSPAGVVPWMALTNRLFATVMVWAVALIGHQFIHVRLGTRKQAWLRGGQVGLSAKIRGQLRVSELGETALRHFGEYLDCEVGAFYVVEPGGTLAWRAGFGAPPGTADAPPTLRLGEGLVGQAAVDSRTFHVADLPDDYVRISSATGSARPRHLVIAPTRADGRVNGVIELGSFKPFSPDALELLELTSESLGIAIRSAQHGTRLEALLDQSQRQAEQLQAQQEELRVSNEELEEQSRALRESQARLEAQQSELEQTNAQLEHQAQALQQHRDELQRAQGGLRAKAEELENANRYKSEFLANMSHELRTPLNSSLILARLLAENREGNLTDEQVKFARTIYSAGNDLLALISDILDLSKIEAGHLQVHPERVDLSQTIESLTRMFQPVAKEKGLRFEARLEEGAPRTVRTDPQRLEQVLKNFLSNAFKFTEKGEVALLISSEGDERLRFSVRDTGIGIAAHQHQVIFEAFRQADGTSNRMYGGTGLGLSISRDLARLLGGEVRVDSEPGRGSTFSLVLPLQYRDSAAKPPMALAPPPAPPEGRADSAGATGPERAPEPTQAPPSIAAEPSSGGAAREQGERSILIIEDDATFAEILCQISAELGFKCRVATRAQEGLELATRWQPSAVLLDIGLPDDSGLGVLDRLKRNPATRHIPVHVISGADHAQSALEMGAVGHLLKPVEREQLLSAFGKLESRLNQKIGRVLIVEDDAAQRDAICELLSGERVECVAVSTAEEALAQLKGSTFDCMVMDLGLPDATGDALLEKMNKDELYAFPPVIVYTGRSLKPEEEQRLRRHSTSIIVKGAKSPARLLDEVTLFLHQVESQLPLERRRLLQQARSRDATLEGRNVLVVEDDVRNVFALSSVLEPRGAKVEIARNGREALSALERLESVDLVLMDVMMPVMDGLDAMREIRKRPQWQKLPIIALTAKAMGDDRQRCLEAGANDYVAKPIDVEKLLSLVRVWIRK